VRRRLASASYDRPYGSAEANGTYTVTALIFRGHISSVVTTEGVKEAKGHVEFIPQLTNETISRASTRLGGLRASRHESAASTAATNFEGLEYYSHERPDSHYHSHSGEGPEERYPGKGPERYPGEGPEYYPSKEAPEYYPGREGPEYYPGMPDPEYGPPKYGFGPEDSYHSYRGKVLVKGGSLRVTLVEAEYY
jgi:hypothetical protein